MFQARCITCTGQNAFLFSEGSAEDKRFLALLAHAGVSPQADAVEERLQGQPSGSSGHEGHPAEDAAAVPATAAVYTQAAADSRPSDAAGLHALPDEQPGPQEKRQSAVPAACAGITEASAGTAAADGSLTRPSAPPGPGALRTEGQSHAGPSAEKSSSPQQEPAPLSRLLAAASQAGPASSGRQPSGLEERLSLGLATEAAASVDAGSLQADEWLTGQALPAEALQVAAAVPLSLSGAAAGSWQRQAASSVTELASTEPDEAQPGQAAGSLQPQGSQGQVDTQHAHQAGSGAATSEGNSTHPAGDALPGEGKAELMRVRSVGTSDFGLESLTSMASEADLLSSAPGARQTGKLSFVLHS